VSAVGQRRLRTVEWEDPRELAAEAGEMAGLEFMRLVAEGRRPPPPIARLLDMSIVEVSPGRAVFAMEPAEWMYNPIGSVHGGVAATILDSCMGCAVHTTLEAGVGYTTTDLQRDASCTPAAARPPPRDGCSSRTTRPCCSPTAAPAA
jgi:Domain of unknown function (DUF4442)